jgi:hypothetical protein
MVTTANAARQHPHPSHASAHPRLWLRDGPVANVVGDPNAGRHTVEEWVSRSAFQCLNIQTQAGQFGNAGRNIVRGPSYTSVDVALVRDVPLTGTGRLQLRAEAFSVTNHVNLGLPVSDLNPPSFGRILAAGPPRLIQFAVRFAF